MIQHSLHVQLSPEAANCLDSKSPNRNLAGETLAQWLIRSFESQEVRRLFHPSLFSRTIEVDEQTPLLLEAMTRIQNTTPEALIESWLMETPRQSDVFPASEGVGVISDDSLGKMAMILDLGETLFEQTIADAQEKLGGSYPESVNVAQASGKVFKALRGLLGLCGSTGKPDLNIGSCGTGDISKS
jgi:hypothetical protein